MGPALKQQPVSAWTPNGVVDQCYNAHVIQDKLQSKDAKRISRRAFEVFRRTTAEPGSQEELYLAALQSAVVSFANGMKNLKRQHHDELRAAQLQFNVRDGQFDTAQLIGIINRFGWQLGGTVTLGVVAFLLMKTLSAFDLVPDMLLNTKGSTNNYLSAFVGTSISALVGYITVKWTSISRNRVAKEFGDLTSASHIRYARGKKTLLSDTWEKLCRAWKAYTGTEWPEPMPSYLRVADEELLFTEQRARLIEKTAQSDIAVILGAVAEYSQKRGEERRKKKIAEAA